MVMRMIDDDGGGSYLVSGSIWFESRLSSRFGCRGLVWLWVQVHSSRLIQHRVNPVNRSMSVNIGQRSQTSQHIRLTGQSWSTGISVQLRFTTMVNWSTRDVVKS
ncbi:hypothetical protein HanRHA438_Chr06g0271891 [Helianthus annuus]|uniref:Uncharacterized protein n=1 Tax=Helianthus annuus TaxID=4232 RepID=A0A9K3NJB5_HELAN|nr:hypothetical protein HanXRQr2_Chr06g0262651 [Helianthus annuus]KAJ0560798.1 hypothetical protein HanHA300_Chr06g0215441 [Helianthus annuus]KAJ0567227.1 hypothetical protein HanIR_Chr06g0282411 [Helianthus annuus]KAJ0573835.1 hypothetical protein HanHA89_Chr06g0231221 [Helianthus annuus]KAJ0738170.1 hypothetical protein HanLR1_Chr06g0215151 [Helianthus annuus]